MNRKTVKIDKDLFDEIMFTDYLEWGTLLDDNNDYYFKVNDILTSSKYTEKLA